MAQAQQPHLERSLTLMQATAINMIDMVGIGPFVTLPVIVGLMQGPASIFAWLLGALLAYMDGMVWAELGAQYPDAGGSYVFLQKLWGDVSPKLGRLAAFLFIWQTTIQAPLVIASGAIGFAKYFSYLVPLSDLAKKGVSGALVIFLIALLYRNIKSVGKISVVLWGITIGTFVWLIGSGIPHSDFHRALNVDLSFFSGKNLLFAALGQATLKATYSYLGYYNVCHLGGEIKNPAKNIPKSILLSITGIAIAYLLMQTVVLGVLPWQTVAGSDFVVSIFFEKIYGSHLVGVFATVLILIIALASLFSAILGYSRIPYAAARNGDFFKIFGKLHPTQHFPHVSLLLIGAIAFVFSLLFRLSDVITAILMMRILVQFVGQAVGLIMVRFKYRDRQLPFKMPLFPIPAIISIGIWMFIFFSSDIKFIWGSLLIIGSGVGVYYLRNGYLKKNPDTA